MPEEVRAAALSAFDHLEPHSVVADVVFDSLLDEPEVRTRRLEFVHAQRRVDVKVHETEERLSLDICVTPPSHARVTIRAITPDQLIAIRAQTETDIKGQAVVADVAAGLLSVVVRPFEGDAPAVATAWLRY